MIRVVTLVTALFVATPAAANESDWMADATLATVRPGPPLYLYAEPRVERGRAYVVAGDPLVVKARDGKFALVEFVNAKGRGQSGYVLAARLEPVPARNAPPAAWVGNWSRVEASITIAASRQAGRLLAAGEATWGMFDPERVRRGGVNIGSFDAIFAPRDGQAAFGTGGEDEAGGTRFRSLGGQMLTVFSYEGSEDRCRIRLRLLGPYLLADDNNQCGGMNVSFDGTYRRSTAR